MRKSRFTENEMVRAVKQFESGVSADTISREYTTAINLNRCLS